MSRQGEPISGLNKKFENFYDWKSEFWHKRRLQKYADRKRRENIFYKSIIEIFALFIAALPLWTSLNYLLFRDLNAMWLLGVLIMFGGVTYVVVEDLENW